MSIKMASPCDKKKTSSISKSVKKERRPSEPRCCLVCKKSILLCRYTNLSSVRKGSSSDTQKKKGIITILRSVLGYDDDDDGAGGQDNDKRCQEWKFICDQCRLQAEDIYKHCKKKKANITDEMVETKRQFIAKYDSAEELRISRPSTPTRTRSRTPVSSPSSLASPHLKRLSSSTPHLPGVSKPALVSPSAKSRPSHALLPQQRTYRPKEGSKSSPGPIKARQQQTKTHATTKTRPASITKTSTDDHNLGASEIGHKERSLHSQITGPNKVTTISSLQDNGTRALFDNNSSVVTAVTTSTPHTYAKGTSEPQVSYTTATQSLVTNTTQSSKTATLYLGITSAQSVSPTATQFMFPATTPSLDTAATQSLDTFTTQSSDNTTTQSLDTTTTQASDTTTTHLVNKEATNVSQPSHIEDSECARQTQNAEGPSPTMSHMDGSSSLMQPTNADDQITTYQTPSMNMLGNSQMPFLKTEDLPPMQPSTIEDPAHQTNSSNTKDPTSTPFSYAYEMENQTNPSVTDRNGSETQRTKQYSWLKPSGDVDKDAMTQIRRPTDLNIAGPDAVHTPQTNSKWASFREEQYTVDPKTNISQMPVLEVEDLEDCNGLTNPNRSKPYTNVHAADGQDKLVEGQMLDPEADSSFQMQPLVKVEDADSMTLGEIKELRLVMDIKEAAFREESRVNKGKISDKQLQAVITQHQKHKDECDRLKTIEKIRMKETLKDKLEARRKSRKLSPVKSTMVYGEPHDKQSHPKKANNHKSPELHNQNRIAEDKRNMGEGERQRNQQEYKRITESHARDRTDLQQKLSLQKKRQGQSLLDKLAARKMRKEHKEDEDDTLSANEFKEFQTALYQKSNEFQQEMEEVKDTKSPEELQILLDAHRHEVDLIQQHLDMEKEQMHADLIAKFEGRQKERNQKTVEKCPITAEDITDFQLLIEEKESAFQDELRTKERKVSNIEYHRIIDDHNRKMDDLQNLLHREKLRMEQKFKEKLDARRKRPACASEREEETGEPIMINQEIKELEVAIETRIVALSQEAAELRPLLTDEEYEQMLANHREELTHLKVQLQDAMRKQSQHLKDKLTRNSQDDIAFDRLQRLINSIGDEDYDLESLTQEEFHELEDDLHHYNRVTQTKIQTQEGILSKAQLDKLISEHQLKMNACYRTLESQRQHIWMVLSEDLGVSQEEAPMMRSQGEDSDLEDEYFDATSSEDDDQVADNKDLPDPVVISASTQLWTTPTQLPVLEMVPRREEYPVRSRRQLYTDPSIFEHLDRHAIMLAQTASLVTQPSFSALVNELTRIGTTELEKVRLIFRWITAQNCQFMDLADAIDDTPLGVLKGLYHTKITFATLFMRMCRFVGLRCVEISGCAKLKGYQPGVQYLTLEDSSYAHTWNAVRIDGYWHFIDCNWGVSYIPGSVTSDPFRFEYDEHYFLADPSTMIKTHFPRIASWQLLIQPITVKQFNEAVPVKPDFFKFGFELLSHQEAVVDIVNGNLEIRIGCPSGLLLSCKVSLVVGGSNVTSNGTNLCRYVFIHQISDGIMSCRMRLPEPGHYFVTFYAKQQFDNGDFNIDTPTEICKYYIRSYAPCDDLEPLPMSPSNHWGMIGVETAGLIPITHQDSIIKATIGDDVHIRFKKLQDLRISYEITEDEYHGRRKKVPVSAIQRYVDDDIVFTLSLHQIGRYGFHLYWVRDVPIHLCSYLIVMSHDPDGPITSQQIVPQCIPPPPTGEDYGPSVAFQDLGISSFTHPDPFIRTDDSDLQIVFGLPQSRLTLNESFSHHRTDGTCKELSHKVHRQFESGEGDTASVTYFLNLKKSGYYQFRLEGKERHAQKTQFTWLYNFLIRRN